MFESLCQSVHEKLVSGKCPWCGHEIVDGRDLQSEHDFPLPKLDKLAGLDAKEAIQVLHALLKTGNASLRTMAVIRLGQMGSDAKELLPDLTLLLEDEDEKVRAAAKEAIRKITEAKGEGQA